jgi:hypothetical protein
MLTTEKSLLVITNYTWTFFYETGDQDLKLVQTVAMPDIEWEANVERINKIKYSNKFLVNFFIFLLQSAKCHNRPR